MGRRIVPILDVKSPEKAGNTGKYKTGRIKGTWEYRVYRREDIK